MSIGERLRELVTRLNQSEFANLLKVSPTTVTYYYNGRNYPSLDSIYNIVDSYPNFNVNWLLFGQGEMFTKTSDSVNQINTYGQGNSIGTVNSGAGAIITGNRSGGAGQEHKIQQLESELRQVNTVLLMKNNEIDLLNKHIANLERSLDNCQKMLEIRREMGM